MAQTKEELLQYFAGLDIALLQRLQKYSQLLIIPDEDLLTNATMVQMVEKAHSLADVLFPQWTDRSKSDFGEFLVELFAVFSEKDFWYLNAFANEGILQKMRSYSNAFAKASSLGYQPALCKGATAQFQVTFAAGSAVTYKRGDLVISAGGAKFTNDTDFTVEAASGAINKTLSLNEGTQIAEDITYSGYSVLVRKENIDIDSLRVIIDNIIYTRVRNFGSSGISSTHYMVLPEEDGSVNIFFGSDGFGVQPKIGKGIRVEYRKCNGTDGNVTKTAAEVNDSLSNRRATAVTMLGDATGGTYPASFTSIKQQAPLYFSTKGSAINERISEDTLNSFNFVRQSKVTVIGREVNYRIIPVSGSKEPSASELQYINQNFVPYIMIGYVGTYTTNTYVNVLSRLAADRLYIDCIIAPNYSKTAIESSVQQIISDVTNPLVKAKYGGALIKADLDLLIRSSVPGVQSTAFKMLKGQTESVMPDLVLAATEIFDTIDLSKVTVRTNVV